MHCLPHVVLDKWSSYRGGGLSRFDCSKGKTHRKNFGGPKLCPRLGFLPFSQGYISFPCYCTRLQLGTKYNIW